VAVHSPACVSFFNNSYFQLSATLIFIFTLFFLSTLFSTPLTCFFFFLLLLFVCAHIYIKKNHYRVLFFFLLFTFNKQQTRDGIAMGTICLIVKLAVSTVSIAS